MTISRQRQTLEVKLIKMILQYFRNKDLLIPLHVFASTQCVSNSVKNQGIKVENKHTVMPYLKDEPANTYHCSCGFLPIFRPFSRTLYKSK